MKQVDFLPIGTIVLLKGASKRIMITGYLSVKDDEESIIYDYNGVMFPEGFLSSDQSCLFNHDQIERIDFKGFQDDEQKLFLEQLIKLIENLKQQKEDNVEALEEI